MGEDSETCGFRVRNDSPELGRLLGGVGWGRAGALRWPGRRGGAEDGVLDGCRGPHLV